MAFFSKLKERLFRSSSKLDEGLDAIVEDGGEEEVLETPVEEVLVPDPVLEEPSPEREREREREREPEPEREPEAQARFDGALAWPIQAYSRASHLG